MRALFIFLIFFCTVSISKAQIIDSTRTNRPDEIVVVQVPLDTTLPVDYFEPIEIDTLYFKRSVKIESKVVINRNLLRSLLRPFYYTEIDSLTKDTIFRPKLRESVSAFSGDTSYVPFPKPKNPIIVSGFFAIDTLRIFNTVKPVKIVKKYEVRDLAWWENKNSIGFDISEMAFVNWTAGGQNSISGLLKIYFSRTFQKEYSLWKTEIFARYGMNKQQEREWRKTDDQIRINSTYGYRKNEDSKWYYTVKLNFNTQFTNGYKYPNTENPISRFFSPAYLFVGAGAQYNLREKHFFIYLSPMTFKSTFVLDETLSNQGAYGVDPGKKLRKEFGAGIQSHWETEIFKNVAMINRIGLYSDYLNSFGSIDVDWELIFKFKINDIFQANIGAHLIYDDDIKFEEDKDGDGIPETYGARVQLKQQLTVGVLYNF